LAGACKRADPLMEAMISFDALISARADGFEIRNKGSGHSVPLLFL
jgi:hypothetical protein